MAKRGQKVYLDPAAMSVLDTERVRLRSLGLPATCSDAVISLARPRIPDLGRPQPEET